MEWAHQVFLQNPDQGINWLGYGLSAFVGFLVAVLLYVIVLRPANRNLFLREERKKKMVFTNLASHYLLTPITVIQTAVAHLEEGGSTMSIEQRQKLLQAIHVGQERLWLIAEQLILVNEIDQQTFSIHHATCDLSTIVTDALAHLDVIARNRGILIHYTEKLTYLREVSVDKHRLLQAVAAIIDNAIKFSQEGGEIYIRLQEEKAIFTLEVEDRGIGMSADVLEHLSEKFYRGNDLYAFNYEGIGLGLHLASAIIWRHGGELTFESNLGRGTTARIKLQASVIE